MSDLQGTDLLFRRWDAGPRLARPKLSSFSSTGSALTRGAGISGVSTLAARGFASYAVELRGFGRSPERPRGHIESFEVWTRDILALREMIGRDLPGRKIVLVGESMGGLVAYDVAARHPGRFDAVVLMAPAFKNGLKFPLSTYAKIGLIPFAPKLMIDLPFTSEMATRDPDYAAVMNASPDELRQASIKLMAGFLPVQARAGRLARRASGAHAPHHPGHRSPRRRAGRI